MEQTARNEAFQPVAGLMAAVLPGLGYVYFGEVRRAIYAFAGVMGLFVGGLLIGGIDAVDRKEDFFWFIPQAGMGPLAFGVDYLHQTQLKGTAVRSIGRVNEVGTLWVAIAGMMNIIIVLDCLVHEPGKRLGGAA